MCCIPNVCGRIYCCFALHMDTNELRKHVLNAPVKCGSARSICGYASLHNDTTIIRKNLRSSRNKSFNSVELQYKCPFVLIHSLDVCCNLFILVPFEQLSVYLKTTYVSLYYLNQLMHLFLNYIKIT